MRERLQKLLSGAGICSRRAAENYILAGRVKVNGITANLGDSADANQDEILVDGKKLPNSQSKLIYIMLNKPRGVVTTLSDEAGRKTVLDLLQGISERVYPIGRLDMYSEGLLLLTNDGHLTHHVTHPSHEVYKEYLVKLFPDDPELASPEKALYEVTELDGKPLAPFKCRLLTKTETGYVMTLSIREGRNRQIRRMCAKCGYTVHSLKRVSEGAIKLGDLPIGQWRYLTAQEVQYLKSL